MRSILVLFTFLSATVSWGQLDAYLDGKYFMTPEGPIYETYLEVYASTLKFQKEKDQKAKCSVEVVQILKKGDSIVHFYKEILTNGDLSSDSIIENLLQVKRYPIENGTIYSLEVTIKDLVANSLPQTVEREVIPHFSEINCEVSDIELLASFSETTEPNVLSKSGYDLVTLLTDFLSPEYEKIAYYFEFYNTDKAYGDDKFCST